MQKVSHVSEVMYTAVNVLRDSFFAATNYYFGAVFPAKKVGPGIILLPICYLRNAPRVPTLRSLFNGFGTDGTVRRKLHRENLHNAGDGEFGHRHSRLGVTKRSNASHEISARQLTARR